MTTVTPTFAHILAPSVAAIQASETSFALNSLAEMFDWSKGAAQKNSARITASNLPAIEPLVAQTAIPALVSKKASEDVPADIFTRVGRLLDAARDCPARVPALLGSQAQQLNAFQFAKLMSAVEETGNNWSESEKYFVFVYPSGSVGSVWLGGCEVYNSIWKNF